MQVDAADVGHEQRGIDGDAGHGLFSLHPQRDGIDPVDQSQSSGRADEVEGAHAIECLAEQHESSADLGLSPFGLPPRGGPDASRRNVGHAPFEGLEHLLGFSERGLVGFAGADAREVFEADAATCEGGQQRIPTGVVDGVEHDQVE